jgi:hypothetical protein
MKWGSAPPAKNIPVLTQQYITEVCKKSNDYRELRLGKLIHRTGFDWTGRGTGLDSPELEQSRPLLDSQFVHLAAVYEDVSRIGLARTHCFSQSEGLLHRAYITA